MFKRFTCMILSFVLLLALLPAGAIKASAASNTTSSKAVTILKVVEQFHAECDYVTGEIGYGTPCTGTGVHGGTNHTIREDEADVALKKALQDLDTVLNTFASDNGISLNQGQHDALVLFTFRNGRAWMNGSDDLRTAVVQGTKGNAFLNQMINWRGNTDPEYRQVLANMYLNGKYNSAAPDNFVKITYMPEGGSLQTTKTEFYYDINLSESVLQIPTRAGYRFTGWSDSHKARVQVITDKMPKQDTTVYATWQADSVTEKNPVDYSSVGKITLPGNKTYKQLGGKADKGYSVKGKVDTEKRYVDKNYDEWLLITFAEEFKDGKNVNKDYSFKNGRWVKWRNVLPGGKVYSDGGSGSGGGDWILVTVTNGYINVRDKANIFATQTGTVLQSEQYWVADTTENNGYLWGHIYDLKGVEVGYVALMYTDYDDVINGYGSGSTAATPVDKVVARAKIVAKAYVNVRSGAGTGNPIVSSLRNDTQVDLYETKYVNGQQWGRCKAGWFSLAYAEVTRLTAESTGTDIGFMSYVFSGELINSGDLMDAMGSTNAFDVSTLGKDDKKPKDGEKVTVSNITINNADGTTWGKVSYGKVSWGWIQVTDDLGDFTATVDFDPIKFTTVALTSVRNDHVNGAERLTTLAVGTEVTVLKMVADEDTIWGYTDVDKSGGGKYNGWVNLSQKYFSRNGVKLEEPKNEDATIVTLATVANCVEVNVRSKASIYGTAYMQLPAGTTMEVSSGPVNGTRKTGWYLLNINPGDGKEAWVRGDYLNIYDGPRSDVNYGKQSSEITSPDGTAAATGRGMVANTYGGVNVRTAPGTANAQLTKLLPGTEVTILEVKYHGTTKWGKLTLADGRTGWACMDYIAMMDYDDLPTASKPVVTEKAVYTGYIDVDTTQITELGNVRAIDSSDRVIVYSSANSLDDNIVRYLEAGDAVTIHELLTATEVEDRDFGTTDDYVSTTVTHTSYWARINDGYIKLPGYTVALDALDEDVYTVTGTDFLKVRKAPGTGADRHEFDLKKYDQVKVTNLQIIQANVWGQIEHNGLESTEEAWISLAYCTKGGIDAPVEGGEAEGGENGGTTVVPTVQSTGNTGVCNYAGTIIGQYPEVTVRKDATTNSAEVTKLKKGTAVTITETRLVDGTSWGYCGSGWIALLYVDLAPVGITAIDAKVIGNDGAVVYESSEKGAMAVGSYVRRAVVNIYEEVNGMYKTDMGWISKANILN